MIVLGVLIVGMVVVLAGAGALLGSVERVPAARLPERVPQVTARWVREEVHVDPGGGQVAVRESMEMYDSVSPNLLTLYGNSDTFKT